MFFAVPVPAAVASLVVVAVVEAVALGAAAPLAAAVGFRV